MEKTMRFLSIAALALVGTMTVGCTSDDNVTAQPQQQVADKGNVVTMTATVGFDEQAATRALTIDGSKGVKTFAVGEKMAVIYKNTSNESVRAVSAALTAKDIASGNKSASFTFNLTNPDKTQDVTYIYPAAMAKDDGTVNYDALNSQNGTLATLAADLDYCTKSGSWNSGNLPTLTLENKLAILALTIKNSNGTSDLTSSITSLSIGDGTNVYSVTRSAAEGPIYVAIQPTTSATIGVNATDGTTHYYKELASKTYAADNGYPVTWKMAQGGAHLSAVAADFTANNGDVLTGTLASNVKISIADGATVTLKNVTITGTNVDDDAYKHAGITSGDNSTIVLEGENTVKGFYEDYPGIYMPVDKTLTIQGTGSLNASSNGRGAGIGGGESISCGNIVINSGTITATGGENGAGIGGGWDGTCSTITINGGTVIATGGGSAAGIGGGRERGTCGTITINGGTVTATGGEDGAGIGGGLEGTCGDITITSGVAKVTATKGSGAPNSIGAGNSGTCGTVTIDGVANPTTLSDFTNFTLSVSDNTWTLTHK